jgi:type I restriction enzyme S subunit
MNAANLKVTETGGRSATTRHIPPKLALAVGMPATSAPKGWQWSALTSLAKLESGHTPSRKHPEYWGGSIPWISISDARANNGRRIEDTAEKTNELGISNSSARILPPNTVCLSRTASVGYVLVMGQPMATSQDFVNWVCSKNLDHNFLKYLIIAEGKDLLRFASGSVHQTIYFPEAKAFHISHPPLAEQQRIVGLLDEAFEGLATAKANAEKNLQNARALFESHLQSVFTQRGPGWVETTLGRATDGIFTGPFGSLLHKSDYIADGIPLVNPAHITEVGIEPDLHKTVSKATASRLKNYIMRDGDIVIGRRGEMGRCALVTEVED